MMWTFLILLFSVSNKNTCVDPHGLLPGICAHFLAIMSFLMGNKATKNILEKTLSDGVSANLKPLLNYLY